MIGCPQCRSKPLLNPRHTCQTAPVLAGDRGRVVERGKGVGDRRNRGGRKTQTGRGRESERVRQRCRQRYEHSSRQVRHRYSMPENGEMEREKGILMIQHPELAVRQACVCAPRLDGLLQLVEHARHILRSGQGPPCSGHKVVDKCQPVSSLHRLQLMLAICPPPRIHTNFQAHMAAWRDDCPPCHTWQQAPALCKHLQDHSLHSEHMQELHPTDRTEVSFELGLRLLQLKPLSVHSSSCSAVTQRVQSLSAS